MATPVEYVGVKAARRLVAGERFTIVIERDAPLLGMSRIDTVGEAWDRVGSSRYFYTIGPTREAAASGDQRVGALSIRARMEQASALPVSVGQAVDDLSRALGFMRVRRVDSVDVKEATDVAKQADKAEEERKEGAGKTTVEKLADAVKGAGTAAGEAFRDAFGLLKLVLIVAVVGGVYAVIKETKGLRT